MIYHLTAGRLRLYCTAAADRGASTTAEKRRSGTLFRHAQYSSGMRASSQLRSRGSSSSSDRVPGWKGGGGESGHVTSCRIAWCTS